MIRRRPGLPTPTAGLPTVHCSLRGAKAPYRLMLGFVVLRAVLNSQEHNTMSNFRTLFTSESVTEGHPDKIADQISDAILDAVLAEDPVGRVACETLVTTGLAIVAGEITTSCYVDFPSIVRETIKEVGYTRDRKSTRLNSS